MKKKTTYELELKIGAAMDPSWKEKLEKAQEGLEGINSLADKITSGIAASVKSAANTATTAISSAVETYKGFEQEMATVQAISGATASQYEALKEAALDAGSSTIFTAEESASALEYMSLAGWSVEESIAGLTPMLRMAAATGKDLQTTSDLVTDSMSALGLGVDDLESYMDKLVETNNDANTTAEQLMTALVSAGGASRVLGVSLDDTITSLGVLANNGTKAEEAGTALNAIFVRLAGNSQAIKELGKLNVDIWDDNGEFIGWQESLEAIDSALSSLSDEQKALSLKNIAGTTHYSQFEYLLEAVRENADGSESAWNALESQVESSSGALGRMYDTTTDTLENAQAKLNSAKEDMQIRLVDVFSDEAKDFIVWLADNLPKATATLVEFAETNRDAFGDMLEDAEDGIVSLWEGGISAFQWLIKNKSATVGAIKAVAAQIGLLKLATVGISIAQSLTNPINAGLTVLALGATVIGALAGHMDDLAESAKNADLESHFGSISLSLEDIEDVAGRIVGSDSLTGVLEALEQYGELDTYQQDIDDAVETLNKLDWKVSIGMELTEDENESYKSAISAFSKAAQDYALQEQYAVQLSLSLAYDENDLADSDIVSKVNSFYSDKYSELSALGTSLNEAITEAFNDGLLEIDEMDKISEIQKQMADIQSQLAAGEMDAQLALLEQKYSGIELDASSFEQLEEELARQTEEAMEVYDEAFVKDYQSVFSAYDNGNGTLTKDEYEQAIKDLNENYASQKASVQMKALNFELNTINEGYGDEIEQYRQTVSDAISDYSDDDWTNSPFTVWQELIDDIQNNGIDDASKSAVNELLEKMQPTIDSLYELAEQDWYSLDNDTQEALTSAIRNVELLQAMSASDKSSADGIMGIYRDVANQVAESDDDSNVKNFVEEHYGEITDYAKPVVDEAYTSSQEYLQTVFSTPFSVTSNVEVSLTPSYDESKLEAMGKYYGSTYSSLSKYSSIMSNAEGGIYDSPILTTFAEDGPEAAIPLDGSDRAKSLWAKAGQILGTLQGESRDSDILSGISKTSESTASGNMQVSFSPVVNIQGNASKEDVQEALSLSLDELRGMLVEIERENGRVSFG